MGHPYHASPGATLTRLVTQRLGQRARFDKPGTIARMSATLASPVDLDEAYRVGRAAAERAADGESDVMTNLVRRGDDPYVCEVGATPLTEVANRTRTLPDEFIGADGRDVTPAFRRYALPLLGPSPFFAYERL